MTLAVKLIFALFIITISGRSLLFFIDKRRELEFGCLLSLALSFTLGLGLISLQMFLYSLIGIAFSVAAIALPWIGVFVFCLFYFKGAVQTIKCASGERVLCGSLDALKGLGLLGWLFLFIIISQVVFAFYSALLMPLAGWDAWAIWFIKAKVFFVEGRVATEFLLDQSYIFTHHDYPLLLPLIGAWIYTATSTAQETLVKVIFPLQFVSMLVLFHFFISRKYVRGALLFTALLSLVPLVMTQAGGLPVSIGGLNSGDYVGYADIIVALFFMGSAGFIYLYMIELRPVHLILSAFFLAFGAWTKNEGMTFALFALGAVAIYIFLERRKGEAAKTLPLLSLHRIAFFLIPLALISIWTLYKADIGIGSQFTQATSFDVVLANLNRLPYIIKNFMWAFFVNFQLSSFTWYAYVISSIIAFRQNISKPLIFLHAMLMAQLLIYIFVYIINPEDLELAGIMDISVLKRTLQLLPLAMLITSLNLSALIFNADAADERR